MRSILNGTTRSFHGNQNRSSYRCPRPKSEQSEIDKRLQLEVRVAAIEKHLGIDKKIAA
jgi:hypothetical protein